VNIIIKKKYIVCDIFLLSFSIGYIIYNFFLEFIKFNYFILQIILCYEIFNLVKIIIIFCIINIIKNDKSKIVKYWLFLSIISLILVIIFWAVVLHAFANGA